MRRLTLLLTILLPTVSLLVPTAASAFDPAVECKSAKKPSTDLKTYFETCKARAAKERTSSGLVAAAAAATIYDSRVPVASLNFASVPTWSDADILAQFAATRDNRYLTDNQHPGSQRRLSWMYPDDGCFSRAEQVNAQVAQAGKTKPYKLFAMGDLAPATTNHPDGWVGWGWHVVPVVKNSAGELIVLDAALSPCKPLPWKTWLLMMVSDLNHFNDTAAGRGVALGDPNAYYPSSLAQGEPSHAAESVSHQRDTYLGYEYSRAVELGRDPNVVFGSTPPWSGTACVSVSQESGGGTVAANSTGTVNVSCPFATLAVGGGAEVSSSSQLLAKSAKNGNGWQVVVRNNSSSSTQVFPVVACLTGARVSASVTTVNGPTVNVGAGSFSTSSASCPSGTLIGGGYNTTAGSSIMRVYTDRRSTTNANTWEASAQNTTSSTKSITAYAYCLGGTSLTYSQVAGPTGSAFAACATPKWLVGGGYTFPRTTSHVVRDLGFFDSSFLLDLLPWEPNMTTYAECLAHP